MRGTLQSRATHRWLKPVPMNPTMKPHTLTVVAALLAATLIPTATFAKAAEKPMATSQPTAPGLSDEERGRLSAARKVASDTPEVSAAYEQAKADKAAARKAYLDFKSTRERANSSEESWRKLHEAALAKADPAAPALVEKEKAAFRARMVASRPESKKGQRPAVKVAEDDGDDAGSEDPLG